MLFLKHWLYKMNVDVPYYDFLLRYWYYRATFAFFLIISKYKSFKLKNIITSYRKKLLSPCSRMTLKELINYIFLKGQFNILLHFRSKKRNQLNDKNFYFQDFTFPIYFSNFSLGCPPFNFVNVFLWIGCKIKILGWLLELRTACILYIEKWTKMAVKKFRKIYSKTYQTMVYREYSDVNICILPCTKKAFSFKRMMEVRMSRHGRIKTFTYNIFLTILFSNFSLTTGEKFLAESFHLFFLFL